MRRLRHRDLAEHALPAPAAGGGRRWSPWCWCWSGRATSATSSSRRWPTSASPAAGLTVLTGLNGQISLGHGALMAVGAYTTALLLGDDAGRRRWSSCSSLATGRHRRGRRRRRRGGRAAARPLPGRRDAGVRRRRCPALALHFTATLGGAHGLTVRLAETPPWVARRGVRSSPRSDCRSSASPAWPGHACSSSCCWPTSARSRVGRALAGRARRRGRGRAGRHARRAGAGARRSWSARPAPALAGGLLASSSGSPRRAASRWRCRPALLTAVVLGGLGSLAGALIGAAAARRSCPTGLTTSAQRSGSRRRPGGRAGARWSTALVLVRS